MKKTILVLGAGTGGVITAHQLIKGLSKKGNEIFKVVLFEKEVRSIFAPSLLWLLVGMRKPAQIFKPVTNLKKKDLELVQGTIEHVDPASKIVKVNGKEYRGDYMVISLGVEQTTEHDLDKSGFDFYTLQGAADFFEKLKNFNGGKIVVLVPSLPFKCPAAPYEAALLIHDYIKRKGLENKSDISIYTPEPGPMSVAGKEISGQVRMTVESRGIQYFPEHQFTAVNDSALVFQNGKSVHYDLLAYTPKHQCPPVIKTTSLVGNSGWVEVDRHTMESKYPDVYAIGDITSIPLEMGKPLPKAGVFAHYQAKVVAHNIIQKISGKESDQKFMGDGQCFLETGGGKAGYAAGNFYASPKPLVKMKRPGIWWHWTKVWFEKYWFYKYF
ncbi:MAG: FAD/NAD(P)-binding oxidoreductase [Cyclobacteriaceae bacterium]